MDMGKISKYIGLDLCSVHKTLFQKNLLRAIQCHVNFAGTLASTSLGFTYMSKACTVYRLALHLYCSPVYLKRECYYQELFSFKPEKHRV